MRVTTEMLEEGRVSFRAVPTDAAKAEPFEAFYRREYRPVVGLVVALGGDTSSAEDVAQDAFLAAKRQWEKVGMSSTGFATTTTAELSP